MRHEQISDRHLVYTITEPPRRGDLVLGHRGGDRGRQLSEFTQADINRHRLFYRHTGPGQLRDSFTFDVSDGQLALRGLTFDISVIPANIPLTTHNISVAEGNQRLLDASVINVTSAYFSSRPLQYTLAQEPLAGWVEDSGQPGTRLQRFTHQQLVQGRLFYVHDHSDSHGDYFIISVTDTKTGKKSLPVTVFVAVTPANDQPPKVSQ